MSKQTPDEIVKEAALGRVKELQAEVAALREIRDDLTLQMEFQEERAKRAERDLAEARALLARLRKAAEDYWLAMGQACDEKREGHEVCEALAAEMNESARFLDQRRDEAPGKDD